MQIVDLLGFSQTCHVSADLTKACPQALRRISVFFSLQHFSIFFLFSISGSDSRRADGRLLAAFDSEKSHGSGKS